MFTEECHKLRSFDKFSHYIKCELGLLSNSSLSEIEMEIESFDEFNNSLENWAVNFWNIESERLWFEKDMTYFIDNKNADVVKPPLSHVKGLYFAWINKRLPEDETLNDFARAFSWLIHKKKITLDEIECSLKNKIGRPESEQRVGTLMAFIKSNFILSDTRQNLNINDDKTVRERIQKLGFGSVNEIKEKLKNKNIENGDAYVHYKQLQKNRVRNNRDVKILTADEHFISKVSEAYYWYLKYIENGNELDLRPEHIKTGKKN